MAESLRVWNFPLVWSKADLDALDSDQIVEGYTSTKRGDPEPGENRGRAFWHGWRNAMIDMGEIEGDEACRQLAREFVAAQRAKKPVHG